MSAVAAPSPMFHVTDPSTNLPLVGGKVYTYAAGTTSTPKTTWSDFDQSSPNTNPVTLNANGDAPIFLNGFYKIVVKRSNGTLVFELDGVFGGNANSNAYTFGTRAEAMALVPADISDAPPYIRIEGYGAAGDGGGGLYEQVGSEPTHAAKLSIILGDGGTVWYELVDYLVVPKQLGAAGDSVTNDTAPVTDWLDLPIKYSKRVPDGGYSIDPITVEGAELDLRGTGLTRSRFIQRAGTTGALLTLHDAVHAYIEGIGIDGNKSGAPAGGAGLAFTGAESGGNGMWVKGCGFFSCVGAGLDIGGTYTKIEVSDNICESCNGDGIACSTGGGGYIGRNRLVTNGGTGLTSINGDRIRIKDNFAQANVGANYYIKTALYPIVEGNSSMVGSAAGIKIEDCTDINVNGNTVDHPGSIGIDVLHCIYGTISNNVIDLPVTRGINIHKNGAAAASSHLDITGNTVRESLAAGISLDDAPDCTLGLNRVFDYGLGGVETYGYVLTNFSLRTTMIGNVAKGVGTGLIVGADADDLHWVGNNFVSNGTPTVIAGTTTATSTGNNV